MEKTSTVSDRTEKLSHRPRVGQIDFVNCLPVNLPIDEQLVECEAEFISGDPYSLNEMMRAGMLDISPVSSYFYLTSEELCLLPDLSISSQGRVGSVLFYYKKSSIRSAKPIAVPDTSATSINLLRIMLARDFGLEPALVRTVDASPDDPDFSGVLKIGDRALCFANESVLRSNEEVNCVDLGEWFFNSFKLPMVFAVWVAADSFAKNHPDRVAQIGEALVRSKRIGMTSCLDQVVGSASRKTGLSAQRMRRYYVDELDFDFTDSHRQGLSRFHDLLCRHKLI